MSAETSYQVEAFTRDGKWLQYGRTKSEAERDMDLKFARKVHDGPIGFLALTERNGPFGRQESQWFLDGAER